MTVRNAVTKTLLYQGQAISKGSHSKPISGGGESAEFKVYGVD